MSSYDEISGKAHEIYHLAKKISNLVGRPIFRQMVEDVGPLTREEIYEAICQSDYDKLRSFVAQFGRKRLDECSTRELRSLAKQRNIPYYSHMQKAELLWEIVSHELTRKVD